MDSHLEDSRSSKSQLPRATMKEVGDENAHKGSALSTHYFNYQVRLRIYIGTLWRSNRNWLRVSLNPGKDKWNFADAEIFRNQSNSPTVVQKGLVVSPQSSSHAFFDLRGVPPPTLYVFTFKPERKRISSSKATFRRNWWSATNHP